MDWSSDVCSSDLARSRRLHVRHQGPERAGRGRHRDGDGRQRRRNPAADAGRDRSEHHDPGDPDYARRRQRVQGEPARAGGTGGRSGQAAGRRRRGPSAPVHARSGAGGSSGSHYDTALAPNALMETAINDSLDASLNLDISANLLQDTGWTLNDGNARIGNCDTGVDVVDDAGTIIGANVQARSEEHTSELQSLMRISYAVFCLK